MVLFADFVQSTRQRRHRFKLLLLEYFNIEMSLYSIYPKIFKFQNRLSTSVSKRDISCTNTRIVDGGSVMYTQKNRMGLNKTEKKPLPSDVFHFVVRNNFSLIFSELLFV